VLRGVGGEGYVRFGMLEMMMMMGRMVVNLRMGGEMLWF
jgi:hypothetical protein